MGDEATDSNGNEEEQKDARRGARGCLITVGVLAILAVIFVVIATNIDFSDEDYVRLSARVAIRDGTWLVVSNDDKYYWVEVQFYLDGILNGYEYLHRVIAPGGTVNIQLREFVNDDGLRFNPLAQKPREIYFSAWVPRSGGVEAFPTEENRAKGSFSAGW